MHSKHDFPKKPTEANRYNKQLLGLICLNRIKFHKKRDAWLEILNKYVS